MTAPHGSLKANWLPLGTALIVGRGCTYNRGWKKVNFGARREAKLAKRFCFWVKFCEPSPSTILTQFPASSRDSIRCRLKTSHGPELRDYSQPLDIAIVHTFCACRSVRCVENVLKSRGLGNLSASPERACDRQQFWQSSL